MSKEELMEALRNAIIMGHLDADDEGYDGTMEGTPGALELVEQVLNEGANPQKVLELFNESMETVGEKFESGEFILPDMLASAECVGDAMDILEPKLKESVGVKRKGKFLIATVQGDLHDIGKNIVITMLKGAGYQVKDLGIDVSTEDIIEAVKEYNPDYVGLSALLTTTMIQMEHVVKKIRESGFDDIKIFIGGAPTSEEFAQEIGADLYCNDAMDTIEKIEKLGNTRTAS
ncbi:MAG: cobalamin B12-binding domain-containing protein [Spirochaetota bacterium]